ncbi:ABC transporter substrate-binding protein [Rhodococcus sp. NPDC058521]|uniref:ABC transporter substrate-binding protein n=1 Tax=Rhodococcus sp. NPDC058521 TaxID=3346536 RepID=UPI0036545A03
MHVSLRRTPTILCAAVLLASGCASNDQGAGENIESGGNYPVTIENCGHTVTVDSPPRRAVSLNQGSTEILLSLGLADRMVGTATWTDPVRDNLAADNERVPRLTDNNPAFEVVLDTEPDFVSASFVGTLGPGGGVADRDQFDKLGVPNYVSPADCEGKTDGGDSDGARTEPLRIDAIYKEIRDLAAVFDVRERGEQFVSELQARFEVASDAIDASGVSLAYWFADIQAPYMAGCCGSPGVMTDSVGAQNIFADTADEWPQVSWETVLDRDPTALVLGDLSRRSIEGDSLDSKIAFLESNPVTQRLSAVRDKRYIIVNGADMNPSIRTVDGVEKVAEALRGWGMTN